GSFAGQLVCQGCFVPFALMASVHAAAEPTDSPTPVTERLPRPAPRRAADPRDPAPGAGAAAEDSEHTRVINVIPGVLPRPARTRRDVALHVLRLHFPDGETVEVAAGYSIRLGRDPQLCPAVTFLARRDNLSRIHARVGVEADGSAWITDEGSTNGTYVRGYRLGANEAAPLQPGDTFRLAADVTVNVLP
ncbi:MAG: FHA domain-containing protein, partial [Streptomyces sp.]|nr:FHA domain-containing protein [Streptomyces sp.]